MNRRTMIGAGGAAAVLAGLGYWSKFGSSGGVSGPVGALNAQEAADVDTSGIVEMTLGVDDAPITMIEYASFTCPHCRNFHEQVFKPLKRDYIDTGKVKFIYRDVYFDRYGLWAAMVARCDGGERFFGISEMLYTQQQDWLAENDPAAIAEKLRRIGKVAGIEVDTLEACLNDQEKAKALIAWYQKNAEADEVSATPTVLIDGEKQPQGSYDEIKAILDAKLAE